MSLSCGNRQKTIYINSHAIGSLRCKRQKHGTQRLSVFVNSREVINFVIQFTGQSIKVKCLRIRASRNGIPVDQP